MAAGPPGTDRAARSVTRPVYLSRTTSTADPSAQAISAGQSSAPEERTTQNTLDQLAASTSTLTESFDLVSLAANTTETRDLTSHNTGRVRQGDIIIFLGAELTHGLVVQGVFPAPADDTIRMRISNTTASPIDEMNKPFYFALLKELTNA